MIILNIGDASAAQDYIPDAESFLAKAKTCLFKLLERNIFTKPKDEIAIFLMGTTEAKNNLSLEHGGYDHITLAVPFVSPSWDILRVLRNDIQSTKHKTDWLDALIVAVDYIKCEQL